MTQRGILIGLVAALAFMGLYWLALNNMTADDYIQFEECIGLVFLSLIAFGGLGILFSISFGEILFNFMENLGDKQNELGNTRVARLWYQRCIRLDDRLLNNTWRRVSVMGKLSKIYDQDGHPELVNQLELRQQRVRKLEELPPSSRRMTIKESVENSAIFKYAFVILFGTVAIVYSINASAQVASMIFLFGIALNGYWLHTLKKDEVS